MQRAPVVVQIGSANSVKGDLTRTGSICHGCDERRIRHSALLVQLNTWPFDSGTRMLGCVAGSTMMVMRMY
jgi:hypothetical protein